MAARFPQGYIAARISRALHLDNNNCQRHEIESNLIKSKYYSACSFGHKHDHKKMKPCYRGALHAVLNQPVFSGKSLHENRSPENQYPCGKQLHCAHIWGAPIAIDKRGRVKKKKKEKNRSDYRAVPACRGSDPGGSRLGNFPWVLGNSAWRSSASLVPARNLAKLPERC